MNKKLLILPLLLVSITSCDPSTSSQTSSSTSTIVELLTSNTFNPYILRSSTTIKNATSTVSSSYSNYEVNTEKKILHNYGAKNSFSGLDDPQGKDYINQQFDYYYTPTKSYTKGSDGKYVIGEKTTDIKVFTIAYDFNYLTDSSYEGTTFEGKVVKASTDSFFKKNVSGVESDITISGTLQIISSEYKLTKLVLSYTTTNNYSVSIEINYEYSMPGIELPA